MIPESHADILSQNAFANMATIGPNGEPQNNPVWFISDGETIKVSQNTDKQKYKNISRDARVSLSILDAENPYRYLEVRGSVTSIEPDADYAFINALAQKYTNEDYGFLQPGEERLVLTITPTHTTTM